MNLDSVEELMMQYDKPSANPFELSRKLEALQIASDNRLVIVKQNSGKQKQV